MNRRRFLLTSLAGAVAGPRVAEAQRAGKVPTIGMVLGGTAEMTAHITAAFERRLAELGYTRDRNIRLDYQYPDGTPPGVLAVTNDLLRRNVDLLVTWGTVGGGAAKKANATIPVVFLSVADPVAVDLVTTLARPGGNMTGVTSEASSETYAKRLQLLKEIVPALSRLAVLQTAGDANIAQAVDAINQAARALNVEVVPVNVRDAGELDGAFAAMKQRRAQGLLVIGGAFTWINRQRIAELALATGLPSSHQFRESVAAGGLIGLGADLVEMARQGAGFVDKIVKGARPADLPVEQPSRYELHINLKTAKALGLTIPPSLLARADQVIE